MRTMMQTIKIVMLMTILTKLRLKLKHLGSSNNRGKSYERVVDSWVGHLVKNLNII